MSKGSFRLKREAFGLPAGTIFEHRHYDRDLPHCGNIGHGALVLSWGENGNTQDPGWCGGAFWLPGQLAEDGDWFEPIRPKMTPKEKLLAQIAELKKQVEAL